MPELPEVETVKRILQTQIVNEKIENIVAPYERIIQNDFSYFLDNVINKTIIDISRRGKYLIFILNKGFLVIHLRMEGKFYIKQINDIIDKHEHIIFNLTTKSLRYHDVRKFGTIEYFETKEKLDKYLNQKLGPEPKEATAEELYSKIKTKKQPIKTTLLDQSIIAGLGNIYVDEVLFLSKIHPLTEGSNLTLKDAEEIIKNARLVINEAIELGGTTIRSYTSALGVTGRFQTRLKVHQKKDEECQVCNTIIKKIKVGGRGTYVCESCQRK